MLMSKQAMAAQSTKMLLMTAGLSAREADDLLRLAISVEAPEMRRPLRPILNRISDSTGHAVVVAFKVLAGGVAGNAAYDVLKSVLFTLIHALVSGAVIAQHLDANPHVDNSAVSQPEVRLNAEPTSTWNEQTYWSDLFDWMSAGLVFALDPSADNLSRIRQATELRKGSGLHELDLLTLMHFLWTWDFENSGDASPEDWRSIIHY